MDLLEFPHASRTTGSRFRVRLVWHHRPFQFEVRPLVRHEILAVQSIPPERELELERTVLRFGLLDPDYDRFRQMEEQLPAGIPSVLARTVLHLSYATPDRQQELLQWVERWSSTPEGRVELLAMVFLHLPVQYLWRSEMKEWAVIARAAAMAAGAAGLAVQDWIERGEWKWNIPQAPPLEERVGDRVISPNLVEEYAFSWRKQP